MQELWQASWEVGLGAPARRRACLWLSERAEIETAAWPRQTLVGRALTLGQVAWPTSPVEIWLKVVLTLGLITSILVTMGNCLRAVFPAPLGTKKQNKTKPRKISAPAGEHNFNPSTTRKQRQKDPWVLVQPGLLRPCLQAPWGHIHTRVEWVLQVPALTDFRSGLGLSREAQWRLKIKLFELFI